MRLKLHNCAGLTFYTALREGMFTLNKGKDAKKITKLLSRNNAEILKNYIWSDKRRKKGIFLKYTVWSTNKALLWLVKSVHKSVFSH